MKLEPGINLETIQKPIELFEYCWPKMIISYFCEISSPINKYLIIIQVILFRHKTKKDPNVPYVLSYLKNDLASQVIKRRN